jgi:MFS family permease
VGAALGSLATVVLLDPRWLPLGIGWRVGFAIGAVLGLVIIFFRHSIPESPRWLMTRGHLEEAERVVVALERAIEASGHRLEPAERTITIRPRGPVGFGAIARTMLRKYPTRTVLGLMLITSQAFLYNGVSFTFALILTNFYQVPAHDAGLYLLPFALGNFLGPLLLGHLFDSWGRKPMIAGTYAISAVLLAASGSLFTHGTLSATTQTLIWGLIFFFASAAASSAYLTVSEIFPLELRGMAIALFYAIGTGIGGPVASWLFGRLIDMRTRIYIFYGNLIGSAVLLAAVVVVALFGVKAERTALEQIADPLSKAEEDESTLVPDASAK